MEEVMLWWLAIGFEVRLGMDPLEWFKSNIT
jgi:hypothetical protein